MNNEKIMRLNCAARMFRVPLAWLKQQVEENKIPAVKAGNVYLIKPENVEQFLLQQADRTINNKVADLSGAAKR
jgi:excisionase family DNA binding protein